MVDASETSEPEHEAAPLPVTWFRSRRRDSDLSHLKEDAVAGAASNLVPPPSSRAFRVNFLCFCEKGKNHYCPPAATHQWVPLSTQTVFQKAALASACLPPVFFLRRPFGPPLKQFKFTMHCFHCLHTFLGLRSMLLEIMVFCWNTVADWPPPQFPQNHESLDRKNDPTSLWKSGPVETFFGELNLRESSWKSEAPCFTKKSWWCIKKLFGHWIGPRACPLTFWLNRCLDRNLQTGSGCAPKADSEQSRTGVRFGDFVYKFEVKVSLKFYFFCFHYSDLLRWAAPVSDSSEMLVWNL